MFYQKQMIFYHGSKGGLQGEILPKSRDNCDFGRGFYLGMSERQSGMFVSGAAKPVLYKVSLDLSKIPPERILNLGGNKEWLDFVLFNRGLFDDLMGTAFYQRINEMAENKDIVIGPVADDNLRVAIEKFSANECTDMVLLEALKNNDLGDQIVLKSKDACRKVSILEEHIPIGKELMWYKQLAGELRRNGNIVFEHAKDKYWNKGRRRKDIIQSEIEKGMESDLIEDPGRREF